MLQPHEMDLVGSGAAFLDLERSIERAATVTTPVLLLGDPGTGKESAARTIHLRSSRKHQPFLVVDCSLYYERELERELFGEEEEGKRRLRKGLLEFASKGSCYLANVEELSTSIQERLLAYLESGCLQRLGSDKPIASYVRLMASSGKNLAGIVEGGLFCEAFFRRFESCTLRLPALRDHPEDIAPFVRQLADQFALERSGALGAVEFSADCWAALEAYPWPGNYDELRREALRLLRLGVARIRPELLAPEIVYHWNGRRAEPAVRQVVDEIEELIREFRMMVRLDAEYGDVLLDADDWDLDLRHYTRSV